MNSKDGFQYILAARFAGMAFNIADQAKHSRNAGEITDKQYLAILQVMNRVHAKYSFEMDEIEHKAAEVTYWNRVTVLVVLAGFSLGAIAATALMWWRY